MSLSPLYSTEASKIERLNYYNDVVRTGGNYQLAFLSLDEGDRARIIGQDRGEEKELKGRVGALPDRFKRVPQDLVKTHLDPFFSAQDLANLRSVSKDSLGVDGSASHIIKTYRLAPLLARYCRCNCDNVSEGRKTKALNQLMSLAEGLSQVENLDKPTYQSVGKFFELVEARNLIKMLSAMHTETAPLPDFDSSNLEIGTDADRLIQNAENSRKWMEEHQTTLATFIELNLQGCEVSLLPPEIGKLTALRTLDLQDNHLMILPKEIGQLKELITLWLGDNRLTILPKEIGRLKSLVELGLAGNRLVALPKEIGRLRHLVVLYLPGNQLTALPKTLGRIPALKTPHGGELVLHANGLIDLPRNLLHYKDELREQNQVLQRKTILNRLTRCIERGDDGRGISKLLNKTQKFLGKRMRLKIERCLYDVCKKG